MMSLAVFVFIVFAFGNIFEAESIKCYTCIGSKSSDCYNGVNSSMVVKSCGHLTTTHHSFVDGTASEIKFEELCVKLVVTNTKPEAFVRGCAVVPKHVSPCKFIKRYIPSSSCKFCTTDLCDPETESYQRNSTGLNRL